MSQRKKIGRGLLLLFAALCVSMLVASFYLPSAINPFTAKMEDRDVHIHMKLFMAGGICFLPALLSYGLFRRCFSPPVALFCWLICIGSLIFMLLSMFANGTGARGFLD